MAALRIPGSTLHNRLNDRRRSRSNATKHAPPGTSSAGISVWSSPADGAKGGGDWCDVVEVSSTLVALTVGDVAGHGDAANEAMLAVRRSALQALESMRTPSEVLAAANTFVAGRFDESIVTAVVAFYDRVQRTLVYANAGHPPPLAVARDRASFLVPARADIPLGVYAHHDAQNHAIVLAADSMLVLYTDGVTERERDPIRGERELAHAACLAYGVSDEQHARAIAECVFRSGRGHDDAAVLVLHTALAERRSSARGDRSGFAPA